MSDTTPDSCPRCESGLRFKTASIRVFDCRSVWIGENEFHETTICTERQRDQLAAENTRLRAALATSKDPCTYCQLPKEEMAKCRSGFPGCARADDLMGCPEIGAALEVDRIERELDEARTRIKELADIGGALAAQIEVEAIDAPGSVRRVREWQETVKLCLDGVE